VRHELKKTVGVASLVVIPGNQLDEVIGEGNASLLVEDGGKWVTVEVGGDNVLVGVAEDALHGSVGGSLDDGADLFVGSTLFDLAGKVDDRHVSSGHAEGHASEDTVEGRDDLANSLGSTSARRNDVVASATATTPVFGGRTIDNLLSSGNSVNGSHEAFSDLELVVHSLGHRGKAVSGAGSVGDDVHGRFIFLVVDTHDEHRGIGGRSGAHNLLGTADEVVRCTFGGKVLAGGFDDVFSTSVAPLDGSRVHLRSEGDLLAVNDQASLVTGDLAVEAAVDSVILEHVFGIVGGDEGIVNRNNVDVRVLLGSTEHEATDSAEAVDADVDGHR